MQIMAITVTCVVDAKRQSDIRTKTLLFFIYGLLYEHFRATRRYPLAHAQVEKILIALNQDNIG